MQLHLRRGAAIASALLLTAGFATAQTPVVINEVSYDAPGGDDGQVFVEIYGPAGFDVSNWTIQAVEGQGGGAGLPNNESFTFPSGTLIPADGLLVVADELGSTGTTLVANADFIVGDMDLENGGDAVHLEDDNGRLVDAVAYGPVSVPIGEGTEARDVFAPLSIERCPAGSDTNDNATDFTPNTPSPGVADNCCTAIEWVDQGSGNSISVGLEENVGLDLWVDCVPNGPYLVLASFTDPTVVPPPAPLPVFDATTTALIGLAGLPPFVGWIGLLDTNGASVGTASVDFTGLGALAPAMNADMWVGAISIDAANNFYGTNFVQITLEP